MAELSEQEISERVAILKRFRKLLEMQRAKFQQYLELLENQQSGIENLNDEIVEKQSVLENQIVSNIINLQRVINPIEKMYAQMGSPLCNEIPQLKQDLVNLQKEVIQQNEKNQEMLKYHLIDLRSKLDEMNNPRINPYAGRRNVYATSMNMASMVDVQG